MLALDLWHHNHDVTTKSNFIMINRSALIIIALSHKDILNWSVMELWTVSVFFQHFAEIFRNSQKLALVKKGTYISAIEQIFDVTKCNCDGAI